MKLLTNSKIKKEYVELQKMFKDNSAFFNISLEEQKYFEIKDIVEFLEEYEYIEKIDITDSTKSRTKCWMTIIRTSKFDYFLSDFEEIEKENKKTIETLWVMMIIGWIAAAIGIGIAILY